MNHHDRIARSWRRAVIQQERLTHATVVVQAYTTHRERESVRESVRRTAADLGMTLSEVCGVLGFNLTELVGL